MRSEVIATMHSGKLLVPAGMEEEGLTVEAMALTGGRVETAYGATFYAALISALQGRPVQPGTVILGHRPFRETSKDSAPSSRHPESR
jgi:hypothetical protein